MVTGLTKIGNETGKPVRRNKKLKDPNGCKITLIKRDPFRQAIDAVAEAHKQRVDKAFAKSLGDPEGFERRLAKLRARFDAELTLVMTELQKLVPESSSAPRRQRGGAVKNPTGEDLVQEDGYADKENRRRDRDQGSGKTRLSDESKVTGSKSRNGRLSPQREQAMQRMEEQARMQKRVGETDEQAFSRFITSDPVGREIFAEYRSSELMKVLKSVGCARDDKSVADDEDDDGMDPEAAMEACEKRVSELVARGASAAAAWDEVSLSPTFKCAKRHTVSRVDV
jgi:hypothetical protein